MRPDKAALHATFLVSLCLSGCASGPPLDAQLGDRCMTVAHRNHELGGERSSAPPSPSGLLSPEAIRAVVLVHLGEVNACHEAGLARDATATGRVTIRFVVGDDGSVLTSQVASSSYPLRLVPLCVAAAVRRWRFPAPEGGGVVTVNYPFNLLPPDTEP